MVDAAEPDWPTLDESELDRRLQGARDAFCPFDPDEHVPWFVRNKYLLEGSQATLLVAAIAATEDPAAEGPSESIVRAVSVGDCCLLVFTAAGEVLTFPVAGSDDFGVSPRLLCNHPRQSTGYEFCEVSFGAGDFLVACSDALGKWIFECLESERPQLVFDALLQLLAPADGDVNASETPADEEPGDPPEEDAKTETLQRKGWLRFLPGFGGGDRA